MFFGLDVSFVVIRLILLLLLFFIFLNCIINNISFLNKSDKILGFSGILAILVGLLKMDMYFIQLSVLFFIFPVLLSSIKQIPDKFFYFSIKLFFIISTLYMIGEHVMLHPHHLGLDFNPINIERYNLYLNYFNAGQVDASLLTADFRSVGLYMRTGGYLTNILSLPVILCMCGVFFFVLAREKNSIFNILFALLSGYLVLVSLSTTATIAYIFSLIFYELYINRSKKSLFILSLIILGIIKYISSTDAGFYLFNRQITNLDDPNYYNIFFNYSGLLNLKNIFYMIVGKWDYDTPASVSSHIDLILIILSYGIIISFLLFKRILKPIIKCQNINNLYFRLFSLTMLPAFICLYHHQMTTNINVMLLFTLLLVKSNNFDYVNSHPRQI